MGVILMLITISSPTASCFEKGFGGILSPAYQYMSRKMVSYFYFISEIWNGEASCSPKTVPKDMQLPRWRMHSIRLLRMRLNARKIITGHPQIARAPFATQDHPPASPGSDQVIVQTPIIVGMGCDQSVPKPCLTLNLLVEHVDIMYMDV